MSMTVLAVGRLREKPFREMADEYLKRLSRFGKVREIEVADLPEGSGSPAEEARIREREGEELLSRIRPGDHVVALTIGAGNSTPRGSAGGSASCGFPAKAAWCSSSAGL